MRALGLDIGERRIGVAVSDSLGLTAQGVTVVTRHGLAKDLDVICGVITQYGVERIVVGLPLTMQGTEGVQVKRARAFAQALQRRVELPLAWEDERFTTAQSQRVLLEADVSRRKRKQVIDQLAAQLILQQYLDRQRST